MLRRHQKTNDDGAQAFQEAIFIRHLHEIMLSQDLASIGEITVGE